MMTYLNMTKFSKREIIFSLLTICVSVLCYKKLSFYISFDFNILSFLLVFPFVFRKVSEQKSYRYAYFSLLCIVLYFFLELSSLFFFASVLGVFFFYEGLYGKTNLTAFFFVVIVNPTVLFLSDLFGFEIRLWLTQIAAKLLSFTGSTYEAQGNLILCREEYFQIDPACMGLKMVSLSFLLCIILITYHEKAKKYFYSFWKIILLIVCTYLLVIATNLVRIMLITFLIAKEGTFAHEFIGISAFILYTLLPLVWLVSKCGRKLNEEQHNSEKPIVAVNRKYFIGLCTVLVCSLALIPPLLDVKIEQKETFGKDNIAFDLSGFQLSKARFNVLKLEKDDFLMYIKPPIHFFQADHTPLICWKGSGYKVSQEQMLTIKDKKVYYCQLKKGNDVLYISWWYDSGDEKTTSQMYWRSQSLLKQKKFALVNIVCDNKAALLAKTSHFLKQKILLK